MMTTLHFPNSTAPPIRRIPNVRSVVSYERELEYHRRTKHKLRQTLARGELLLKEKNDFIQQQEFLTRESDHRLLNGLQMVSSLLSMQSRESTNTDVASELAVAARRVGMIGGVHRRLHSLNGAHTVAFKQYLEDFCRDFSAILFGQEAIYVEAIEITLPKSTAVPLAFIVNELLTNAVKYGRGRITVQLQAVPGKGYELSVSNLGTALPQGFNPAASNGLGMTIIRTFTQRIGGELRFSRGDHNQGARFSVLFS